MMTVANTREFEFSDENFEHIKRLVMDHTGIFLTDAKKDMVYGRLSKRVRQGGFGDFNAYCDALVAGDEQELDNLVNAITTNLTSFFRENHHFDYLAQVLIPELIEKKGHNRQLRIWSAGCSTGEEPYSIAMTLKEALPDVEHWDIKILATDLDANALANGQQGIYRQERIAELSEVRIKRWFKQGRGNNTGLVKVSSELQQMIRFKRLNLLQAWPMKGTFDLLFCRNVVIYFDKATQKILFDRFADILTFDGCMFIGHSETLYKVSDRFNALGHTIYRKNGR